MKIAYISSEVVPFAKTGGLADVAGALPEAIAKLKHEIRVFMPEYKMIKDGGFKPEPIGIPLSIPIEDKIVSGRIDMLYMPETEIPVYMINNSGYFERDSLYQQDGKDYKDNLERFVFFCKSVLEALKQLSWQPDIIHCNDWQTALIPVYLKIENDPFFKNTKTLYTIHNLAYQGIFKAIEFPTTGLDWKYFTYDQLEYYGNINLMKAGLAFSDKLNTVSSKYAEEIQTEKYGYGLAGILKYRKDDLSGIINGVDYTVWSPDIDDDLPQKYSLKSLAGKAVCKKILQEKNKLPQNPDTPLIGVISRLADQKGFNLVEEIFDYIMGLDIQFVLLGTGEQKYHDFFQSMQKRYPKQVGVNFTFNNPIAHLIEGGSDMFLMPSLYEPCGLNQMYSLRYGTIPIVRATGGLADTIEEYNAKTNSGNGFVFEEAEPKELYLAIKRSVDLFKQKKVWQALMRRAMKQDFSWNTSAKKYIELYKAL